MIQQNMAEREEYRQRLIRMLGANDKNGCYSDRDTMAEFGEVTSLADLEEAARDQELI